MTVYDLRDKSVFGDFGASIYHISITSSGDVWINLINAVGKFDGEKWTIYPMDKSMVTENGKTSGSNDVFIALPDNKIWMTLQSDDDGIHYLYFFNGEKWVAYTKKDGLLENNVFDATSDHTGNMWFSTSETSTSIRYRGWFNEFQDNYAGTSKFDGTKWTSHQNMKGYLAVDYSGVLWTSSGQTISSFDETPLVTFSELREKLFSKNCDPGDSFGTDIIDMDFSPNGTIWLLFLNCGIANYYQEKWSSYENPEIFRIDFDGTSEICTSPDGELWLLRGQNLYKYSTHANILNKQPIYIPMTGSLACAPDGSIWIGSLSGYVAKYKP